jgi:hypothetical protein
MTASPPQDLRLAVARVPGHPACGFYSVGGQYLDIPVMLGVAVQPANSGTAGSPDTTVAFKTDLGDKDSVSFINGSAQDVEVTTHPGSDIGYLGVGLASKFWDKYRGRTTVVTVTVDPENRVRESNEKNNVVKLRVEPKRKRVLKLAIAENKCSVLG